MQSGPATKAIVPDLIKLLDRDFGGRLLYGVRYIGVDPQNRAVEILGEIGPAAGDAVPTLIARLSKVTNPTFDRTMIAKWPIPRGTYVGLIAVALVKIDGAKLEGQPSNPAMSRRKLCPHQTAPFPSCGGHPIRRAQTPSEGV